MYLKPKYQNSSLSISEVESNFKIIKQLLDDARKFNIHTLTGSNSTKKWNQITILSLAT